MKHGVLALLAINAWLLAVLSAPFVLRGLGFGLGRSRYCFHAQTNESIASSHATFQMFRCGSRA